MFKHMEELLHFLRGFVLYLLGGKNKIPEHLKAQGGLGSKVLDLITRPSKVAFFTSAVIRT